MPNKLEKKPDFKSGSKPNAHINFLLENLSLHEDITFMFTAAEVYKEETYACAIFGDKMLCAHRIPDSDKGKTMNFNLNEITDITKRQGFMQSGQVIITLNDEFVLFDTVNKEDAELLIQELLKHIKLNKQC